MSEPALTRVVQHLRLTAGDADTVSDGSLLDRFLARRDEVAFELLVRRHERLVLGVCRRVLRNPHDADDAFQATFLLLARKAGTISRRAALASWLHQVAYRVALRANDDAKRRSARHADVDPATLPNRQPDASEAQLRELGPILDQELSRLPEKYRAAVALCYLEGCTYEEAGQRLNCPRGTVSIWLTRARDLLRRRLARRGVMLSVGALFAVTSAQAQAAPIVTTVRAAFGSVPVSVRAASLAQGVLTAMFLSKLKFVAGVAIVLAVVVGGGFLFLPSSPADAAPPGVGVPPPPVEKPEPPTWQEERKLVHDATISSLVFSPDAGRLMSTSLDGEIKVWDMASGKMIAEIKSDKGEPIYSGAFSPDGKLLAAAGGVRGKSGQVRVWDAATLEPAGPTATYSDAVTGLAFAPDGRSMVVGGRDKEVRSRDVGTGKLLWTFALPGDSLGVAVSPDARYVAVGTGAEVGEESAKPGRVLLMDARNGQVLFTDSKAEAVRAVAFSPDGKVLASGGSDAAVRLWDVGTGKEVRRVENHKKPITSLAFSPDGQWLASGGDTVVRLWDVADGRESAALMHEVPVTSVAFSPDGKWLATSSGGVIRLWRVGGKAGDPRAAGTPPEAGKKDRLADLLDDLMNQQRGDVQVLEALFLASLGRLPTDVERKLTLEHVSQAKDRRQAFSDLLYQVTHTREFRDHAEALAERARRLEK